MLTVHTSGVGNLDLFAETISFCCGLVFERVQNNAVSSLYLFLSTVLSRNCDGTRNEMTYKRGRVHLRLYFASSSPPAAGVKSVSDLLLILDIAHHSHIMALHCCARSCENMNNVNHVQSDTADFPPKPFNRSLGLLKEIASFCSSLAVKRHKTKLFRILVFLFPFFVSRNFVEHETTPHTNYACPFFPDERGPKTLA